MTRTSVDRLSSIALIGIFIVVILLFVNNKGQSRSIIRQKDIPRVIQDEQNLVSNLDKIQKLRINQELALALKEKGLIDDAIEENKKILLEDDKVITAHLELGRLYNKKENLISAISEYRKVIELEPNYIDEHSKLFLGDELKNTIKKSIFELKKVEKVTPNDKNIQQGLKDAYYLRRKFGRGCE